jgi:hypothetical protein
MNSMVFQGPCSQVRLREGEAKELLNKIVFKKLHSLRRQRRSHFGGFTYGLKCPRENAVGPVQRGSCFEFFLADGGGFCFQAARMACSRVMLKASVARVNSFPTWFNPRVRNWRIPRCCLSTPKTGSTTALRRA